MGFGVLRIGRRASLLVAITLLALPGGLGVAAARPIFSPASLVPPSHLLAPSRAVAGARLVVSGVSSAPAGARAGQRYVLGGTVRNDGASAARGRSSSISFASVIVPSRSDRRSWVLRRTLRRLPRPHPAAAFASRRLVRARRVRARADEAVRSAARRPSAISRSGGARTGARSACPPALRAGTARPGAFAVAVRVAPVSGDRQRRLHERPHRCLPRLRRATNLFLPGTHVVLTDQATQCLTDFSLDFERSSRESRRRSGHDGRRGARQRSARRAFTFVQPTYPGDPNGQNDPDPARTRPRSSNPVGGPENNPLPPACTPELMSTEADQAGLARRHAVSGEQARDHSRRVRSPAATTFVVQVAYTGRPGVHNDGDGTTEGWFSNGQPGDTGSFVTTEPVGSEDWMPLNDHPSAKPTYDFYDTVPLGKDGDRQRRARLADDEPPGCELPGRLDDVALALAGGHRVLPRGEQHRLVRPERAARVERDPVLRGAGQLDSR